ncbi:hypothetical protein M7I_1859 [Glarea lozoyensis 74030]|uniref:Uncharacterized protein n=1 Tax=Glarea lozoyensis (strain ATCC 74030 / MF5533) TaxID=1104152 RepID=H0EH82_GLAL7|nr:hypothetical protein M7I_1859 [Glarea lozoyensis 74030]
MYLPSAPIPRLDEEILTSVFGDRREESSLLVCLLVATIQRCQDQFKIPAFKPGHRRGVLK